MNLHLRTLRRPLFAATAVAALGVGVPAAIALTDAPERPRLEPAAVTAVPPPVAPASTGSVEIGDDISGPCDEAEHANDPECTGVAVTSASNDDDDEAGDISGPCDEAEHADDPECAGAALAD